MNGMELPKACGCAERECDRLTCGTVISTTAQYHNVNNNHTMDKAAGGGCSTTQAAPKVHHSNKTSEPRHGCTPSERHPRKNVAVANTGLYDDLWSTQDSTVDELAVAAQPQLEEVEEIISQILEGETPQAVIAEIMRSHQPEGISPGHPWK